MIIKNAKELPKAKIADISDDIIEVILARQVSKDGLVKCSLPVGTVLKAKVKTLRNGIITDSNGKEHNKVIVDCVDENGNYKFYMFYDLLELSQNLIPNGFHKRHRVK